MTSDSTVCVVISALPTSAGPVCFLCFTGSLGSQPRCFRHRPTESLILPNKRRFFPFRIPNFHTQLRHYISTADPDRIYVVVERIVYAIHIAAQKRESMAVIPFEPRCLAAGYGWIAVGGPENGECAFIRTDERGIQLHGEPSSHQPSDVDSALPLDLEIPSRLPSPDTSSGGTTSARRSPRRLLPEFELHKFGGSIVNSVTIHRFPADREGISNEDVMVLSNNDRTVTVYSLTRAKVLKVLHHPTCMNYAIISPDHKILAAVGDENRVYFYDVAQDGESLVTIESGGNVGGWEWELSRCVEMDIGPRSDDACCFTIAFSPSSHLCAIGSQSGIVSVLDMDRVRETDNDMPVICQFQASRSCTEGGAVRCMTFSPEPWDLLVWLEGHGRAGVADVRQSFLRRQILYLDADGPQVEEVRTTPLADGPEGGHSDDDLEITSRLGFDVDDSPHERDGEDTGHASSRESLLQDLTARERLIMQFLNTARWNAREEMGLTERPEPPARATLHPHPAARSRHHGSTNGTTGVSRPFSPPYLYDSSDIARDGHLGQSSATYLSPRIGRRSSVVLSQENRSSETDAANHDRQPSVTLSWTASSHSELNSHSPDVLSRFNGDPDSVIQEMEARGMAPPHPPEPIPPPNVEFRRSRGQRSSSIPRRVDRPQSNHPGPERRYDPTRLSNYEIRANVAAERLRRQRQIADEVHNRSLAERGQREQRARQQMLGFEQTHSPRWIRNIINDLPERSFIHGPGAEEPDATAGVGWGADGRTLYIATLEGIFEFQLNVHDRKTFPIFSYR
ncbi:uncharacterized protein N7482_002012 [Penicillium canariense]|uniref:DUF2415 domain-containing protein n=1 Tax=Penicillium canariense TaxID=189055 RepID=A0A9W9LU37_9EURO|nr:uncharacterized protein N7482_002012 [Penicillium canariense]KAJ5176135.1 hypothetical protein N7482_002012 [Penicillium canariense]